MTVTTENTIVTAVGNGSTTNFVYDFQVLDPTHVIAFEDGTEDTGITVNVNADQDLNPGGSVDFPVAPANLSEVSIKRLVDYKQLSEYPIAGPFPSESHEEALDKLTMIAQQLGDDIILAIHFPVSDDPAVYSGELPDAVSRANKFLYFDADGQVTVSTSSVIDPNAVQRPVVLVSADRLMAFDALNNAIDSGVSLADLVQLTGAQTLEDKTINGGHVHFLTPQDILGITMSDGLTFTGIPSWATKIHVAWENVDTDSSSATHFCNIGNSSTFVPTAGSAMRMTHDPGNSVSGGISSSSNIIYFEMPSGSSVLWGECEFKRAHETSHIWTFNSHCHDTIGVEQCIAGGIFTYANAIDRVKFSAVSGVGVDGSVMVNYE